MKFLVVFACALAVASAGFVAPYAPLAYAAHHHDYYHGAQHLPVIGPNGVPIDTPEVQHARAAHLAHKVEAHARNGDYAVVAHHAVAPVVAHHAVAPVVAHHAVAAPVVAHHHAYAAHAAPLAYAAHHHHHQAYPTTLTHPTSVNGVPLETPEVVAAKTNHFAAHAEALSRTGHLTYHHLHKRGVFAAPLAYSTPAYGYGYSAYPYGYSAYPYSAYSHYY